MPKSMNKIKSAAIRLAFITSVTFSGIGMAPALADNSVTQDTNNAQTQLTDATQIGLSNPQIDPQEADFANNIYLAYVYSPNNNVNRHAKTGLEVLSLYATDKTTVHPEGVTGINIENDEILFFPLIYWPITDNSQPLSDNAQKKVQSYIDGNGVIIFDIQSPAAERGQALKRVLGDINIRALEHVDKEHSLARTFYLTSDVEGTKGVSPIWIEQQDNDNPENMSSVIITSRKWASEWSGNDVLIGTEAHENSMRMGINLLMYSLTGNYKKDPDHNTSVLEKIELQQLNP